ncbi:membrane protein insertase YidC [Luteolibacter sp. Populi]|uniref:membrane protein insertase YidC n=1 Tax=Luteolibacter sp. Populi TaxID=3230487 RepID=UPI0034666B78
MYDRKTWIVVVACSVLLAVNLYYQQKTRVLVEQDKKERAELIAAEEAKKKAEAPKTPEAEKLAELVEMPPPVQDVETLATLETSEAIFVFTNIGGGLKYAEIKNQSPGIEGPVRLNRHGSHPVGALSEGIDKVGSEPYAFVTEASEPGKSVVFRGKLASGLWAQKTWRLRSTGNEGDPYMLDFKLQIENPGENAVNLENYSVFLGVSTPLDHVEQGNQTGFVVNNNGDFGFHSNTEFAKAWFGMKKARTQITLPLEKGVYAGVSNQFFASVLKPVEPVESLIWSTLRDESLGSDPIKVKALRAGLQLPRVTLAPKEQRTISYEVFTGPKQNRILRKMESAWGSDWGALMNYGFFSPFSRFMNWSLYWVHAGVEKVSSKWSWGLAVVVLTILLRTAIWPLYNRSNRTMKRMAKLKPEMEKLKEKYPDDPQKMNQEMMGMYRKYGINPVGGCLPMFAQLPIFFGFYSMLLHAVEMRGQGFFWWVTDLSQPDTVGHLFGLPINPLPILMALTSFGQMAMMPNTGGDKTQMMIIKLMPFMFLFVCYNFASALALYWTTSNLFSIGQTWLSNRMPEPELKAKAGDGGKMSMMERLAARAEEAQRQQKMRQANGRVVSPDEDAGPGKKRPPRTGG